jgi:hypothetical protein
MNKKGLFGILDDGAGAGKGITLANPDTTLGSAIAATVASPAFINSSGVLVFPQLDAEGRIRVTFDGAGECHDAYDKLIGSTSYQDVAEFTGALSKLYDRIGFSVSSATECDWELVYIDDAAAMTPVETVLSHFMTGPGQYSYGIDSLACVEVDTSAGTGVQKIVLRGKLLEATGSEIAATLWLKEVTE